MTRKRFGLLLALALASGCATSTPPPEPYDEILACNGDSCDSGTMPVPAPAAVCSDPGSCDTILWSPYF